MIRKRCHLFISGRVQGVFFRAGTRQRAITLGLTGWVRNLPDDRVETVFEGEPQAVDAMVDWCRAGTPPARVERLEIAWEEATGAESGFEIRY